MINNSKQEINEAYILNQSVAAEEKTHIVEKVPEVKPEKPKEKEEQKQEDSEYEEYDYEEDPDLEREEKIE